MSETIEPITALAVIPPVKMPTLLKADTKDILGRLRDELRGYVPNAETPEGREKIGSMKRKVGIAKADFDRLRKSEAEDAKKTIDAINAEWKIIEANLDEIRDQIEAPRVAYLAAEKARVEANENAIAALEALADGLDTLSPDEIKARHESIQPFEWSVEFASRGERTRNGVAAQLQIAHQVAKVREAEAVAEAQRQAEAAEYERIALAKARELREEQIARDAAEAATRAAEVEAARKAEEAERAVQAERGAAARALAAAETERLAGIGRERVAAERAEAARIEQHRTFIGIISKSDQFWEEEPQTTLIRQRIEAVAFMLIPHGGGFDQPCARDYEEFQDEAFNAHEAALTRLKAKLEAAIERETEAKRLDQIEQNRIIAERERVIAEEAEKRRAAVEKKAEDDKQATIEAERDRVTREDAAKKAEDDGRAANRAHRGAINRDVLAALMPLISKALPQDATLADALGRDIIEAVARGNIPRMAIDYASAIKGKEGALL